MILYALSYLFYGLGKVYFSRFGGEGTYFFAGGLRLISDNKAVGIANNGREVSTLLFRRFYGLYHVNYFAQALGATRRSSYQEL